MMAEPVAPHRRDQTVIVTTRRRRRSGRECGPGLSIRDGRSAGLSPIQFEELAMLTRDVLDSDEVREARELTDERGRGQRGREGPSCGGASSRNYHRVVSLAPVVRESKVGSQANSRRPALATTILAAFE